MTRLDANGEPSMEEILASIRKIIAEDPPGSRPGPQQAPASSNAPEPRADVSPQSRGSYFPSLTMPQGQAPGAVAASAEPATGGNGLAAEKASPSATSFIPSRDASPGRIEPSFSALSQPKASEPAQPAPTAGPAADPFSIDAQLSDLLSETDRGVEADGEAPKPSETPFSMKPTAPSGEDAFSRDFSPKFSVSRDGYIPEAKAPGAGPARDPFDFKLGPSPFAAKQATEKPTASTSAFPPFASSPDAAAKSPVEEPVAKEAATDAPVPQNRDEQPATTPEPAAKTDDASLEGVTSHTASVAPSTVEPPVVAATAPKDEPFADEASVTVAPKSEAASSFGGFGKPTSPVKRDVMEFASALKTPVQQTETPSSVPATSEAALEAPDFSAGLPVTQSDAEQRSMEDTVAELLRPMLRTWLAENMPRIVERALMRELEGQLPPVDRKTAAE